MNPALLQATGLPRAGLVCWHDLWFPNVLLQSNTFSTTWAATRASVVESASVYVPGSTTRKAWKLVEDNTAANSHNLIQNLALPDNTTITCACFIQPAERSHVRFGFFNKAGSFQTGIFHLEGAGEVTDVSAGATTQITPSGDGYVCVVTGATASGASTPFFCFYLATDTKATSYDGTGTSPYAEDDPGIYIADAQLYPAATLPGYVQTTTLQSIPDLSGNGNVLTRGSNASASDSNDPTVLGPGLSFLTDDYALTGNLSGIDMDSSWTAVVCGIFPLQPTGRAAWSLSDGASTNAEQTLISSGAANGVKLQTKDAAGYDLSSSKLTASGAAPEALVIRCSDGVMTAWYCQNPSTTISLISRTLTNGTPRIGIGCSARSVVTNIVETLTFHSHLFYNRALSTSEIQRAYRYLKAQWAARGVTIL